MNRQEMIAFVHALIGRLENDIFLAEKNGRIEEGDYTWQMYVFENTGVCVSNETAIADLTDAELHQIVEAYN